VSDAVERCPAALRELHGAAQPARTEPELRIQNENGKGQMALSPHPTSFAFRWGSYSGYREGRPASVEPPVLNQSGVVNYRPALAEALPKEAVPNY